MIDDLDEIFGIPTSEKKNDDHAGAEEAAFSDTMNDSNGIEFEDQKGKLNNAIKNVRRSSQNKDVKINDGKTKIQADQNGSDADEAIEDHNSREKDHNAVDINHADSNKEDEKKVDPIRIEKNINEKEKSFSNIFLNFNVICREAELESFYNIKRDALSSWLLPGGVIDFYSTTEELRQAKPDLSQVVFGDMKSMFLALQNIQKWKHRITSIQIDVNQQFYAWKRAIDLFRGVLARCKYEKPSEKQDGVVMEHMGDMVMYMSRLESLHASASAVRENLDNAFDCISRQITASVSTIGKDVEQVERKTAATISESLNSDDFDSVASGNAKKEVRNNSTPKNAKGSKAGEIDWT